MPYSVTKMSEAERKKHGPVDDIMEDLDKMARKFLRKATEKWMAAEKPVTNSHFEMLLAFMIRAYMTQVVHNLDDHDRQNAMKSLFHSLNGIMIVDVPPEHAQLILEELYAEWSEFAAEKLGESANDKPQ